MSTNLYKIPFLKKGVFTDSKGIQDVYTEDDLKELVDSYNSELFEAPILIGHDSDRLAASKDDLPSYGWIKSVELDDSGVYALANIAPELENLLTREVPAYKNISGAIYPKNHPSNPTKGKLYLRHIAFLGGTPPAIKGLPDTVRLYKSSDKFRFLSFSNPMDIMQIPDPNVATPEEVNEFLQANAANFITNVLSEQNNMTIVELIPDPTEENNYLLNVETNGFEGSFVTDEGEKYTFTIFQLDGGEWKTDIAPEISESEPAEFSDPIEEEAENVALEALKQEIQSLKSLIEDMRSSRIEEYAESKRPLLEKVDFSVDDFKTILRTLDSQPRTYSEGEVDSQSKFRELFDKISAKVSSTTVVTYGEMAPEEEEELEEVSTTGVVPEENSMKLHKKILQFCEKNKMNPQKPEDYMKAYKALA